LADVPASAAFFPGVDRLTPQGDGVYRWELAPVGPPQARLRTVYLARYVADRAAGTVAWTPVEGGTARVDGVWRIVPSGEGTQISLHTACSMELPLPALLGRVVGPAVEVSFRGSIDTYVQGLIRRFGGTR
jgi:carbon monoxide dehydrogenase subunit G